MTFFPEFNRIYPSSGRQDPEVKVSPVMREKKEKEPFKNPFNHEHSEEEVSVIGALKLLLDRLSDVVERHKAFSASALPSNLLYALLDLKYFFNALPTLPEAGFDELYTHLASVWLYIDEQLRLMSSPKWQGSSHFKKLTQLLAEIGGYKTEESEPFSYYLIRQHEGESCPHPLRQILLSLKMPTSTSSHLSSWIEQIEQITS